MKKIKRNLLCIIFFLIILFINNKVKATNITISPTNPKVGDTVTVTVSVPNVNTVDVTANVSGVVSGNIKVVGGDLSGAAKSYSNSAQYKCDKEGTISVSVTSNSTAVLNGNYVGVSANKSVNVSKTSSNTSNSTEQKNNQSNQEKSNNANLSNLGIRPNDFSGFSPTKTSYSVTVPNEVESVEVYAGKGQNGQKISGTGSKTLKEGLNTFNITVTAEDGKTTKTYTLNIVRKEQEVKEENTISEGNVVENIENNIDANTLLEGNVENSIEEPSNDVSNQLLISTKDDSKINKKLISDCIIGVAFAIIILLLIIYYTTQYNKDEDFEEQEDNTNSVEPEEEKSKKEEINKEANKNETINVDIEVPKKHQKGKRFK